MADEKRDELKACPFCGGEAKIHGRMVKTGDRKGDEVPAAVSIRCKKCGASSGRTGNWSLAMHIKAWNSRPTPAIGAEALEKVREAIWQILDDGEYTNGDGDIVIDSERKTGGSFCHAAAIKLIEAYMSLAAHGKG